MTTSNNDQAADGVTQVSSPASLKFKKVRSVVVDVELATDQLGGGVEPKVGLAKEWLRSSAVRGAVRFWWRAIYAPTFKTLASMQQAERELFGGPAGGIAGSCGWAG